MHFTIVSIVSINDKIFKTLIFTYLSTFKVAFITDAGLETHKVEVESNDSADPLCCHANITSYCFI